MPEIDAIQVVTTTENEVDARRIAAKLMEGRLAACVQIGGPIESHYRWQGQLEAAKEWTCTIKTRRELYDQVEATIREMHPYDVPEILATPVVVGSESYLDWLRKETE